MFKMWPASYQEFQAEAQRLHESPAEVVGEAIRATAVYDLAAAIAAAFDDSAEFNAAWRDDSCGALERIESHL